jgi:hypothetical protein
VRSELAPAKNRSKRIFSEFITVEFATHHIDVDKYCMKRLIFAVAPLCFAVCLAAGCGSNDTRTIEASVSEQDETYAQESLDEYGSPEYAKAMADEKK